MGLKCGIVGLPNVGKSTLFNALSDAKAEAANYPFCTIDPKVGVVEVPDNRLDKLAELVSPEKVIPTFMEFVDIAGLVKGASKGEGLGNQFLANIREANAIIHVVRCFEDENITHVDGRVNPVEDKDVIDTELQLRDLESVDKKILKVQKQAKSGDAKLKREYEILLKYKEHLEGGQNVRNFDASEEEEDAVADLQLLTAKPVIYVANVEETSVIDGNEHSAKLKDSIASENAELILVSAAIEADIASLGDEDEKAMFLEEYGLSESGLSKLIRASYKLLDLITYFTAGEKEVRAWTIKEGWTAPQAAGVIHTDFERGFIKAEVIGYNDYVENGSESACRDAGKLRMEGKEYVVVDGDVMHFKFNV